MLGLLGLLGLRADLSSSTVDLVEEVGLLSVLRESEIEELKHDWLVLPQSPPLLQHSFS